MNILYAVIVLGVLAIVFGLILAVAAKVFEVEVDPRLPEIQAALAGANCGGCGYPCLLYTSPSAGFFRGFGGVIGSFFYILFQNLPQIPQDRGGQRADFVVILSSVWGGIGPP